LNRSENPRGYRAEITELEVRLDTASQRADGFKRGWIAIQISCCRVEMTIDSLASWLCQNTAANSRQCYSCNDANGDN